MGSDETALVRLCQEKRSEIEPEDLSGNLIVQFGLVTEELNRRRFERERATALRRGEKQPKSLTSFSFIGWLAPEEPPPPDKFAE